MIYVNIIINNPINIFVSKLCNCVRDSVWIWMIETTMVRGEEGLAGQWWPGDGSDQNCNENYIEPPEWWGWLISVIPHHHKPIITITVKPTPATQLSIIKSRSTTTIHNSTTVLPPNMIYIVIYSYTYYNYKGEIQSRRLKKVVINTFPGSRTPPLNMKNATYFFLPLILLILISNVSFIWYLFTIKMYT